MAVRDVVLAEPSELAAEISDYVNQFIIRGSKARLAAVAGSECGHCLKPRFNQENCNEPFDEDDSY
jgi:hypothetical protein